MNTRQMRVTVDGRTYHVTVELLDDLIGAGSTTELPSAAPPARPALAQPKPVAPPVAAPAPAAPAPRPAAGPAGPGAVTSPLAGTVVNVLVQVGQPVAAGDTVVILEAMKMETPIASPHGGTVTEIKVAAGAVVGEGAVLVVVG